MIQLKTIKLTGYSIRSSENSTLLGNKVEDNKVDRDDSGRLELVLSLRIDDNRIKAAENWLKSKSV